MGSSKLAEDIVVDRRAEGIDKDVVEMAGHGWLFLVFGRAECHQRLDWDEKDVESGDIVKDLGRLVRCIASALAGGTAAAAAAEVD